MNIELKGKLVKVLEMQNGTTEKGNWFKQGIVIETIEEYPKKVHIIVWGALTESIKRFNIGDVLKAGINIESREFNDKWYTDVRAWRLQKDSEGTDVSASDNNQQNSSEDVLQDSSNEAFDDLPF